MRQCSRHIRVESIALIITLVILTGWVPVFGQDDRPSPTEAPSPPSREQVETPPSSAPAPKPSERPRRPTAPARGRSGETPAADAPGASRADVEASEAAERDAPPDTEEARPAEPSRGRPASPEAAAEEQPPEGDTVPAADGEVSQSATAEEPSTEAAGDAAAPAPVATSSPSAEGSGESEEQQAATHRRAVRDRRTQAIEQSIERLRAEDAEELSETQRAALIGQIAQGARVDIGSLREETAEARLTLESLQQMARQIREDRRTVPHQVRTGQIPSLGASNRWDALQETNQELQDTIDRAFSERLRLLLAIPNAEDALEEVRSLQRSSGQSFDASSRSVLNDAERYLKERLKAMQDLLAVYNEQAAVATDAYEQSSQYTEELSAAMVAARGRGLLARSETGISWETFKAIGASISRLPELASRIAPSYEEQGTPPETMTGYLLRLTASGLLLAGLILLWAKLPGWLLAASDSGNGEEPPNADGGDDLRALRDRRQAELITPVARAAALAAIAAVALQLWGLPQEWIMAALAVLGTWAGYFAFVAVVRQLLAPRHVDLRIVPIDDSAAGALFRLLRALALWTTIMLPIIWALSVLEYEHEDVLVLLSVVHVVGLAVLAGWIIYAQGGPAEFVEGAEDGTDRPLRRVATAAVPIVLGLVAAIAILKAIGYVNLGAWMARILYLELPLLVVALVLDWQIRRRFAANSRWRTRLRAGLWLAFGLAQIWVFGLRYHHWLAVVDFLKRPLFTVAENEVSTFSILEAILVIVIAWLVARFVRGWLERSQRLRNRLSEGIQYALSSLTFYVIIIAGILWAMLVGGFPLNALTVLAGMAGIGLGFGLQEIVKNFVAGLILLIERPLAVGDYIEVSGTWGRVMSISLRSTVVRTQDNVHILVPNGDIITNQLTNLSHHDRTLRLVIPVGVSYDSDIDHVMDILIDVAKQNPNLREFPEPSARLKEFGDSAIVVELLVWISDPEGQIGATVDLNLEIWRALKREGIEIPFPQTDIHLRDDSAPVRIERDAEREE